MKTKTTFKRANQIKVGDIVPVAGKDYEVLEIHKEDDKIKFAMSSSPSKVIVQNWYAYPTDRLAILK